VSEDLQAAIDQNTRNFTYHAPNGDQPKRYELMRAQARVMANSSIARNE
jgi:hypothetical protein